MVLATLPMDTLQTPVLLEPNQECTLKILGLEWEPHTDNFRYTVVTHPQPNPTKRSILSHIARIFDPVGWLSPSVFLAKHLMQLIWESGIGWDDPLPTHLYNSWETFQSQLPELASLRIPRHPKMMRSSDFILVGFSDASEKGYGAVTYPVPTSSQDQDQNSIMLLKAKSKVAPLKPQSIPRLELCGALLLSRLIRSLRDFILNANISTIYLLTDSTIVLACLNTAPHLLKAFVANRVVEILEITSLSSWHHVSTYNNPADLSYRGLYPSNLLHSKMWWSGPNFLSLPVNRWPIIQHTPSHDENPPELKPKTVTLNSNILPVNPFINLMERFSTLSCLQGVMAYVIRFTRNIQKRNSEDRNFGPLTAQTLKVSLNMLVKLTQDEYFAADKQKLSNKQLICHSIQKLSPFLDYDGLLRVGERLRHSILPFSAKHPLLLPKKCHLSTLICDSYHLCSLHGGPRIVQALIQKQCWILSLRSLLRQRIFRCLKCYKFNASANQPMMADLPPSRFSDVRPFLNVGVDMAGPFNIKESKRRNARSHKAYLCLFICMSTKALHLELTSDISTPAFLAALNRFVSRRGLPSHIHSDCGTNFQGAANHLNEVYKFLKKENESICDNLSQRSIQWNLNPPAAPNFGGLWEVGVKSVKHHLRRFKGETSLTFEELTTVFTRIEAVLNSRPLCPISNDPNDDTDFLTPGHFLIGSNLLSPAENDLMHFPDSRLNRWQLLKQLLQSFWKIWSKEYLQTLIERPKWTNGIKNISIGDIVYMKAQNSSPLNLPLARVVDLYPSRDGVLVLKKFAPQEEHLYDQ